MDVGAAFVADEQAFEVVQPREGPLDDPALPAEAGAVCGLAAGDHRPDPALADEAAVLVVVVRAVGRARCRDGGAAGRGDRPPPAPGRAAGSAG